jgi:adenylate kinase family enzyme/ActR/RegA family two-component response regulator
VDQGLPLARGVAMDLRRVAVVGTSCSGKTTFAAALASRLQVPHIELDALHWRPGWVPAPREAFRQAVAAATSADRWVSDGNYGGVRDVVWGRATAVIWLDYPFATVLRRALYRTARRVLLREQLYSGNRETFRRAFLSRDSILWWVVTTWGRRRREYPELFEQAASAHLEVVVLGSPRDADSFLRRNARHPGISPRKGCGAERRPPDLRAISTMRAEQRRLQAMTKQKILLVQDDFLLAEGLRVVIEDAGYEVVGTARDTAGAEKLVAQHRPALAIVDLKLELDVDGIATATALKQNHGLKILITTGFPDSFVKREGVDEIACAVVKKPYMDEEILQAVARCLHPGPAQPS